MNALELAKIAYKHFYHKGLVPDKQAVQAIFHVEKALSEFHGKFGLAYENGVLKKGGVPVFTCKIDIENRMVKFCIFDKEQTSYDIGYSVLYDGDSIETQIAICVAKHIEEKDLL